MSHHRLPRLFVLLTIIDVVSGQYTRNCRLIRSASLKILAPNIASSGFTYTGKYGCCSPNIPFASVYFRHLCPNLRLRARGDHTLSAGLPASLLACATNSWKSVIDILLYPVSPYKLSGLDIRHTQRTVSQDIERAKTTSC